MNKKKEFFEGVIGLVLLAATLALSFFAIQKKHTFFQKNNLYYANFDFVQGVEVGTPVKVNGIDVGHVTDMTLDTKTLTVTMALSIQKTIPVRTDAAVKISGESLLGKKIVVLEPGQDAVLKSGKTIYNTYCANHSLESLIEKFLFSKQSKPSE